MHNTHSNNYASSYFYAALIEWSDEQYGYVRAFWTWASHIGEAIDKILYCAKRHGVSNPVPSQLDPYDFNTLPATAITDDDGETYVANAIRSFIRDSTYRFPYGVIASCIEGEHLIDEINVGYAITQHEDGLIKLSAVVPANNLLSLYLTIVQMAPSLRVFWVKLQEDWEAKDEQPTLYVNEALTTMNAIASFLERHNIDLVFNGHVTLTAFTEIGSININLDDHKMLVVVGHDAELIDTFAAYLEQQGIPQMKNLVNVQTGIHHWHYRHPSSRSRNDLVALLEQEGFQLWDPEADVPDDEQRPA